jgi:hypothetical protein
MYGDTKQVSLRELVSRVLNEGRRIMKTDLALMRAELKARVKWLKIDMILIAGGGFCAILGLLALTVTAVIALSYVWPAWLAALAVGLFLLITGGAAAVVGLNRLGKTDWAPTQTIEMLKEEKAWLQEELA